jgi:aromatic-L-amino-acid decarboxylase
MVQISRPEPFRDLDWSPEQARQLGEDALEIWTDLIRGLHEDLPVIRNSSAAEVRQAVALDIPAAPMSREELSDYLRRVVMEESMYPGHPGFFAYVSGAGTVPGAVADLLASAINQNSGGFRLSPAGTEIEQHLMRWFAHRLGMPVGSTGNVTSGGAIVNFIGLALARTSKAGWDVRAEGLRGGPQLTVYVSTEVHDTIDRASQMLGIGDAGVRRVAVDGSQRIDVAALRRTIAEDIDAGLRPICVVGSAGTTGTGAIDPLAEIADVCAEHNLWFHVDGAYGGAAALTDQLAPLFTGIERADSVGFDPHKWLYTPLVGACVLVRDPTQLTRTFALDTSYIISDDEKTGWGIDSFQMGPQFSRPFSAFNIWVSLLAHGWDAYQRRISQDVALAKYLHEVVAEHPELETMNEPVLSITCFRYVPADLANRTDVDAYLDELNEKIMFELEVGGRVFPSNAIIEGRFALRSCIVNYRVEAENLDDLVAESVRHGRQLDSELRPAELRERS